jgi:methionine-S-sulfoxide reductase
MRYLFSLVLLMGVLIGQEQTATFGGGCFWCMEGAFQPLKGVSEVDSGYMGGDPLAANYKEVSKGDSGHYEVVRVHYNSDIIGYKQLLEVFWKNIDPTDSKGQFADKGKQYQTVIFYANRDQKTLAKASKKALEDSGKFKKKIATKIKPAQEFFKAENYHQDYFKKNALRYKLYKKGSGREDYIEKTWK